MKAIDLLNSHATKLDVVLTARALAQSVFSRALEEVPPQDRPATLKSLIVAVLMTLGVDPKSSDMIAAKYMESRGEQEAAMDVLLQGEKAEFDDAIKTLKSAN